MSKNTGGDGKGATKEILSSEKQDQVRRATKAGRNRKTKGTMIVHDTPRGMRLNEVGAIAARRKAAYDKARAEEARKEFARQRNEAILKDRKREYERKGQALLVLRQQMDEAEDEFDTLKGNLDTASKDRQGVIKARMRKLESNLRGMQRRRESLEARIAVLDGMIFGGQPLVEARS